jgi:DNA-binding MarR family transcriptional regulator
MGPNPSFTRADKRIIQSLLLALKPLSNLRGSTERERQAVPLRLVTAFLAVASNEGQGVNEYARCLGIHRSNMSRFIHELADRWRNGGPGLDLIKIDHDEGSEQPNKQKIFLTTKGRAVARTTLRRLLSQQTK